ncbi:MAG: ribosome silencing factor [Puniceicoccaceae bacterium]|nr:MAG: ribosome silencing factor [Puniceicoccaceae bacterium]
MIETSPLPEHLHSALRACCRALDDKKAEALAIIDVRGVSSVTDVLVLASAGSEPHLRALRIEVERAFDEEGFGTVGVDGAPDSGWVVVDGFDLMVHLFLPAMREHYQVERLWKDAAPLDAADFLPAVAPRTALG